jgi:hypothetical protein
MDHNLIDELGNALPPAPFTAEEMAAREAMKNATDQYLIVGQFQKCSRFVEFYVETRPQVATVLYVQWCPWCCEHERCKAISVNGAMVSAPRTDIQARPRPETFPVELKCVNCGALSKAELLEAESRKLHITASCSCLEHPTIELSQHRVRRLQDAA